MELVEGKAFVEAEPSEVIDFLRTRRLKTFSLQPDRLRIGNDGRGLFLQFANGKLHQYPIRRSFFLKLLKWYSFHPSQLRRLNIDTITSILNDFLLSISSSPVHVRIEDGEALTITSDRYSEVADMDLVERCKPIGIRKISRDDFFIRLYSDEKDTAEPIKGDVCGFGYNVLNSETGFRALSIQHYILRYTCSNGAVAHIGSKDERIHFGYISDEMWEFISNKLRQGEVSRSKLVERIRESTGEPATDFISGAKQRLRAIIGWRETAALLEDLPPNATRYDLINLITDKAKQYDPGRRLQLELVGGFLITRENQTTTIRMEAQ